MIIARAPLRITLGGGGTDLESYYRRSDGGFLLSAAIDRYVYITVHETYLDDLLVKYSKLERVADAVHLEHPIIREAMRTLELTGHGLEISSIADIPEGTGLGSSGSFTVALLAALCAHLHRVMSPESLAVIAHNIESVKLGEPVGFQDPYIAAYGGVRGMMVDEWGNVETWPLNLSAETMANLEDGLLLFFTGYSRRASDVLREQNARTIDGEAMIRRNLDALKTLAVDARGCLDAGNVRGFAYLLTRSWELKRERSVSTTTNEIDRLFCVGMNAGALGGKLVGAGGGGFLMFYTEDSPRLRHAMLAEGLREQRFRFDHGGARVIVQ